MLVAKDEEKNTRTLTTKYYSNYSTPNSVVNTVSVFTYQQKLKRAVGLLQSHSGLAHSCKDNTV